MIGEKSVEQKKADELNAKIIMMMMEFNKNK